MGNANDWFHAISQSLGLATEVKSSAIDAQQKG